MSEQHRPWRIVYRFTVPIDGIGGTQQWWAATHGWRTSESDNPPSQYIPARIASAGGWTRSAIQNDRMVGAATPSYGVVTLVNVDGGLDDFAMFSGGGGLAECWFGYKDEPFTAYLKLFTANIFSTLPDLDKIHIRLQDRTEGLDVPLVGAMFAGTGGLEGTGTASRLKQLVLGEPGLIPLIETDRTNQTFFVQANATDYDTFASLSTFGAVFEGGVPIPRGPNYVFANDLIFDVDPAPSTYRPWAGYGGAFSINGIVFGDATVAASYTKGPFYVRLGTPPIAELRFGAVGLLANQGEEPRPWTFVDLCNRAGLSDVAPWELGTVAGNTENFDAGNRLIDDDRTVKAVMTDRATALLGGFGFNRLGQLWCATIRGPEEGTDLVRYTFTTDNTENIRRAPIKGLERPVWKVQVKAGRTWPCPVLEGASPEMRDLLTREWATQFTGISRDVKNAYPNAQVLKFEIDGNDFKTVEQQTLFVQRIGQLFGTLRDPWALACKRFDRDALQLDLWDKVKLQMDRYGYDSGVEMRVVHHDVNLDDATVSVVIWGNNTGWHTWDVNGVGFPADSGDPGGSWGGGKPPARIPSIEQLGGLWEDFGQEFYAAMVTEFLSELEWEEFAQEFQLDAEAASGPSPGWYELEDTAPTIAPETALAAMRTTFLTAFTVSGSEGFENGTTYVSGADIDGATAVINGVTVTFAAEPASAAKVRRPRTAISGHHNTTSGGDTVVALYVDDSVATCLMSFSTPIAGFCMYMTDAGDNPVQISLVLHKSGGGTVTHDIAHTIGAPDASQVFVGYFSASETYTQIDFVSTPGAADVFGIDDLSVFTPAQLA